MKKTSTKTSEAYVDPPGMHRHKCGNCGCIFAHDALHRCPDCGEEEFFIYRGPSGPTYVNANPEE